MGKHAYLVGKGRSLDNVTEDWFKDASAEIWCLNQSATAVRKILPNAPMHCVQNDDWIHYTPPDDVFWHCGRQVNTSGFTGKLETYLPETLTGRWADPSCMCALELMRRDGVDKVTMVAFDSHFDGSRDYASLLEVQSDGIAPYHFYDTLMRRWSSAYGVSLVWVDPSGKECPETHQYKRAVLGVAMGTKYERQTDCMISSFLKHNPGWEAEKVYGKDLEGLLPDVCKCWTPFNKCEIGRWIAIRDLLHKHDTVVYCDGDVRWYDTFVGVGNELGLFPHCVTRKASVKMRHQILYDGKANIGIVEVNRGIDHDTLFDYVIGETLHKSSKFMHGQKLWLQNLVDSCADVGFDVGWNMDAGLNVASWNIRRDDRKIMERGDKVMVECNGAEFSLRSFHFSSNSLQKLDGYGDTVRRLKMEYLNEQWNK